jgi:nucleotide-binding universal stress UspA family protein
MLVPLDGSELAERALIIAGDMAESLNATIILTRVVPPPVQGSFYAPRLAEEMQQAQTKDAQAYLDEVAARLRADRLTVDTRLARGEPASGIIRLARDEPCELIVMGSHGMGGLGWHVFGSVAMKVLHGASIPVLIVQSRPEDFDREEEKEETLADAALLSKLPDASQAAR